MCVWLQSISKRPGAKCYHLIAIFLSFPCFELSHLFFKFSYALQEQRALIVNRENARLAFQKLPLEFDKLPLKRRSVPETYDTLRNILERAERAESG